MKPTTGASPISATALKEMRPPGAPDWSPNRATNSDR